MLRQALMVGVLLLASACQTNPKQTVLNLDTTDRKWNSRACVQHRKAVADYNDGERARGVVGLANFATPYVGTAASLLMSWRKDPIRAELNRRVEQACITPTRLQMKGKPYREYAGDRGRSRPRGGGGRYGE